MAKVKTAPEHEAPVFLRRLRTALTQTLDAAGIDAQVQIRPIPTTRLYRVLVLAAKFKALRHTERQDLVWRIVEAALTPDQQMRISMILTLTPQESDGE